MTKHFAEFKYGLQLDKVSICPHIMLRKIDHMGGIKLALIPDVEHRVAFN
jgi:hypothetical protein